MSGTKNYLGYPPYAPGTLQTASGQPLPEAIEIQVVRFVGLNAKVLEAIPLWEEKDKLASPSLLVIQNLGPNVIYYGGEGVTTATGQQIAAAGGAVWLDNVISKTGIIHIIAATADQVSPANTRVAILARIST